MDFFLLTRTGSEPACSGDLFFVNVAGRLIPLTRSAVDRLANAARRETTATPPAHP